MMTLHFCHVKYEYETRLSYYDDVSNKTKYMCINFLKKRILCFMKQESKFCCITSLFRANPAQEL